MKMKAYNFINILVNSASMYLLLAWLTPTINAQDCIPDAGSVSLSESLLCEARNVEFSNTSTTNDTYSYAYVLINDFGEITNIVNAGVLDFAEVANGNYCVYGIAYDPADPFDDSATSLVDLILGSGCFAITADCASINYPLPPEPSISTDISCNGDGTFTVGLTINGGSVLYAIAASGISSVLASNGVEQIFTIDEGEYNFFIEDLETECSNQITVDGSCSLNCPSLGTPMVDISSLCSGEAVRLLVDITNDDGGTLTWYNANTGEIISDPNSVVLSTDNCDGEVIEFYAEYQSTSSTCTLVQSATVAATVYPNISPTVSNDGCTLSISQDCPQFTAEYELASGERIEGFSYTAAAGSSGSINFTITNLDASGLGCFSESITLNFDCAEAVPCPSISNIAVLNGSTERCSGIDVILTADLENGDDGNLNWYETTSGIPVLLANNLIEPINNTCTATIQTFYAEYVPANSDCPAVQTEEISITIYPEITAAFEETTAFDNCFLSLTEVCANFNVSWQDNNGNSGTGTTANFGEAPDYEATVTFTVENPDVTGFDCATATFTSEISCEPAECEPATPQNTMFLFCDGQPYNLNAFNGVTGTAWTNITTNEAVSDPTNMVAENESNCFPVTQTFVAPFYDECLQDTLRDTIDITTYRLIEADIFGANSCEVGISQACSFYSVFWIDSLGRIGDTFDYVAEPGTAGTVHFTVSYVNPFITCTEQTFAVPFSCPEEEIPCEAVSSTISTNDNTTFCPGLFLSYDIAIETDASAATDYLYAYLLVDNAGSIVNIVSDGNIVNVENSFSEYCIYGISYRNDFEEVLNNTNTLDELQSSDICYELSDCLGVTLAEPVEYSIANEAVCLSDSTFSIDINVTGGSGTYLTTLSEAEVQEGITTLTLTEGFYSFYATDALTGCSNDFIIPLNVNCESPIECPTFADAPSVSTSEVCNGEAISLSVNLSDGSSEDITWFNAVTNTPITGNPNNLVLNNTTCEVVSLSFYAQFENDDCPDAIQSEILSVLVYPSIDVELIESSFNVNNCTVEILTNCSNFDLNWTDDLGNTGNGNTITYTEPGITANIEVTVSNSDVATLSCASETESFIYTCELIPCDPIPPINLDIMECSGEDINLNSLSNTGTVWFDAATDEQIVDPFSFGLTNTTCEPMVINLYAPFEDVCNPGTFINDEIVLNIYPEIDATFVNEACNVSIVPTCDNVSISWFDNQGNEGTGDTYIPTPGSVGTVTFLIENTSATLLNCQSAEFSTNFNCSTDGSACLAEAGSFANSLNCISNTISMEVSGANNAAGFGYQFFATNAFGNIVLPFTTNSILNIEELAGGNYNIYGISYDLANPFDNTATTLSELVNGEGCFDITTAYAIGNPVFLSYIVSTQPTCNESDSSFTVGITVSGGSGSYSITAINVNTLSVQDIQTATEGNEILMELPADNFIIDIEDDFGSLCDPENIIEINPDCAVSCPSIVNAAAVNNTVCNGGSILLTADILNEDGGELIWFKEGSSTPIVNPNNVLVNETAICQPTVVNYYAAYQSTNTECGELSSELISVTVYPEFNPQITIENCTISLSTECDDYDIAWIDAMDNFGLGTVYQAAEGSSGEVSFSVGNADFGDCSNIVSVTYNCEPVITTPECDLPNIAIADNASITVCSNETLVDVSNSFSIDGSDDPLNYLLSLNDNILQTNTNGIFNLSDLTANTYCIYAMSGSGLNLNAFVGQNVNDINATYANECYQVATDCLSLALTNCMDIALSVDVDEVAVVDANGLAYTEVITNPINGFLYFNIDGNLVYQPTVSFSTTDFFVYYYTDNGGNDIEVSVSVNITQDIIIIDPCNFVELTPASVLNACTQPVTPVQICFSTEDYGEGSIADISSMFSCSLESINDTCFQYQPLPSMENFSPETLSVTFCATACPDVCETHTVVVDILTTPCNEEEPLNEPPVAVNDAVTTDETTSISIFVLDNDSDPNGDAISITTYSNPIYGSVIFFGTGFNYIPLAGYQGEDSFTYQICDDAGACSTATVVITVENECENTSYVCTEPITPIQICPDFCSLPTDADIEIVDVLTTYNCNVDIIAGSNNCIEYIALPLFVGEETLSIIACANTGECDTAYVVVQVTGCEDGGLGQPDVVDDSAEGAIENSNQKQQANIQGQLDQLTPNIVQQNAEGFSINHTEQVSQILLYDLNGRLLKQIDAGTANTWLTWATYPAGIYLVHLQTQNGQNLTLKAIKR